MDDADTVGRLTSVMYAARLAVSANVETSREAGTGYQAKLEGGGCGGYALTCGDGDEYDEGADDLIDARRARPRILEAPP